MWILCTWIRSIKWKESRLWVGTSSENALVMAVPQNLGVVAVRRKSADVRVGKQTIQVPGNLENSKFLRRLVLTFGFFELPENNVKFNQRAIPLPFPRKKVERFVDYFIFSRKRVNSFIISDVFSDGCMKCKWYQPENL